MAALNKGDLEQRTAILRRFRELLVQQRVKFQRYLLVLDHERADIESGDIDKLVAHVDLEEEVVSEIFTFQKVIAPLEDMYKASYQAAGIEIEAGELPELRRSLVELRGEVLARNAENRALLKERMESLRAEITAMRIPTMARPSVYANAGSGSVLDIQG